MAPADANALAIYKAHPVKAIDLSIDLLLTASSGLLGVLTYVRSGTVTSTPWGTPIKAGDLVMCEFMQVSAVILIFGCTIGLPRMVVGMLALFVVYLLAPVIIDHIEWFAGASILVAAGGVSALSRTTV